MHPKHLQVPNNMSFWARRRTCCRVLVIPQNSIILSAVRCSRTQSKDPLFVGTTTGIKRNSLWCPGSSQLKNRRREGHFAFATTRMGQTPESPTPRLASWGEDASSARRSEAPQLACPYQTEAAGISPAARVDARSPPLPLHTHHLPQRVHNVHQIALRLHDRINRLVRHRRLIDHIRVLSALDASRRLHMILHCEPTLGLRTRHRSARPMAATHEALRIALAAHDVRSRAHASRDNPHIALTSPHRTLTGNKHILAIVV